MSADVPSLIGKNKYYHIIENQMHFNKNNEKLKNYI